YMWNVARNVVDGNEVCAGRCNYVVIAASDDARKRLPSLGDSDWIAAVAYAYLIADAVAHQRHRVVPQSRADDLVDIEIILGTGAAQLVDRVGRVEPITG